MRVSRDMSEFTVEGQKCEEGSPLIAGGETTRWDQQEGEGGLLHTSTFEGTGGDTILQAEEDRLQGEAVMLGSLQRTVNRFKRRLLRFSSTPSTEMSVSSMSGATYLHQKLSTVEGTDEVRVCVYQYRT